MVRKLSLPLTCLASLVTLPIAACTSGGGGGDDSEDVSSALEQPNGGYDTADEAPAFGADAELSAAAIEADASAVDTLATDPTTTSIDRPDVAGFRMALVWGKLPADRGAQDSRDWSGTLKVSRGALIVRHTIGFEDQTDQLLPRPSSDTVAFRSVTRPYVDGLALTVLDPTPEDSSALSLTYTPADGTAAYTLDLAQLVDGPIVVDAGNGFKIVAVGHRRSADACDHGFMRGRWHALSPRLGRFLGVVTDDDGARIGHVRGVFGQRRNGDQVLFGKFIDREGHFRGVLAGSFDAGEYRARWIDRQGDHGTAHGVYFAGATETSGHFLGRWAEASCSDDR